MKLMPLLLLLTGCLSEITPNVFEWAVPLCESNGGVRNLVSYEYEPKNEDFNTAICNNGAIFYRLKK